MSYGRFNLLGIAVKKSDPRNVHQYIFLILCNTLYSTNSKYTICDIDYRRDEIVHEVLKKDNQNVSRIVNEVIRTISNQFIFTKRFHAYKNADQTQTNQQNKIKRTKNNKGNNFSRAGKLLRGF